MDVERHPVHQEKLVMSTARRRLKSPQSLCGTSTHPTRVKQRSQSWSWMINSYPFHSMSISPPIPQIRLFQILTLNYKVKVTCGVKGQGHIAHPVSTRCTSFSFHINRTNHSWDMSNRVFDLEKTHPKNSKKIWQKMSFQQNSSKIYSGDKHDQKDMATKFCMDWLNGSHCRQANFCLSMSQP